MPDAASQPTRAQQAHHDIAVEFIQRHFTDPDVRAEDAAIYMNVSDRTLRGSLKACGTSWRTIVQDLRMERARVLLRQEKFEIAAIARLCGYKSPSGFADVFQERNGLTPHEWRRGRGGPARAGGPTGAFYRPAARARALRDGEDPPVPGGRTAGDQAITAQEIVEAQERIDDRRVLGEARVTASSIEEITEEMYSPARLRDRPEYWRKKRAELDAYIAENDPGPSPRAAGEPRWPR